MEGVHSLQSEVLLRGRGLSGGGAFREDLVPLQPISV
jgi:hypothetical protein